jgi:HipA-like protein
VIDLQSQSLHIKVRTFREWTSSVFEHLRLPLAKAPITGPRRALHLEITKEDGTSVHVGTLVVAPTQFEFSYSIEFRNSGLPPIPTFPDLEKKYESEVLFPFFQMRLPPVGRTDVASVLKSNKVAPDDTFGMLKLLGSRTVASPYRFSSAER